MAKKIQLPMDEETVRSLRVGDALELSGIIYTARDCAHKWLAERDDAEVSPMVPDLRDGAVYHCGPVVHETEDGWIITAAGPTTSIREEFYMPAVIGRYGLRAIIGKGGMGQGTSEACKRYGCVYLHAVGGAAQVLAKSIRCVRDVYCLREFGSPEALWELEVTDFPVVVTMDAVGGNLHECVKEQSARKLAELLMD